MPGLWYAIGHTCCWGLARAAPPNLNSRLWKTMIRRLALWIRGENGAISPLLALMVIPLVGSISLAVEVSFWYANQRTLQNAADSAALAAAANKGTTYSTEAISVAGQYGIVNGTNEFVVTPAKVTCPS